MSTYIAYFDFLGFKDFIENNNLADQQKIMKKNYRDIELALSNGRTKRNENGIAIADISESKVNCINYSDTVVFWTKDDNTESFYELMRIASYYNTNTILRFFPTRGSIVCGELFHIDYRQDNACGSKYVLNSLFGKGLIDAYCKAENLNWAGCVIDNSVVEKIKNTEFAIEMLLKYAVKYKVPYKENTGNQEEYVLRLFGPLNKETFNNLKEDVERNFSDYNKSIDKQSVKDKLANTIKFLHSLIE